MYRKLKTLILALQTKFLKVSDELLTREVILKTTTLKPCISTITNTYWKIKELTIGKIYYLIWSGLCVLTYCLVILIVLFSVAIFYWWALLLSISLDQFILSSKRYCIITRFVLPFLSTSGYAWLTVLNVDIVYIFTKLKNHLILKSKNLRKYALYCFFLVWLPLRLYGKAFNSLYDFNLMRNGGRVLDFVVLFRWKNFYFILIWWLQWRISSLFTLPEKTKKIRFNT